MSGIVAGCWVALGLLATSGATQYIDLASGWSVETRGPWISRADHRGLLAMHHPWEPSAEGNFAMAIRDVTIPPGWEGPIRLAFYASDDYHADGNAPPADAMAGEGFVGHRRKQILVNDTLIWSEDVSDPVRPGTPPYFHVALPPVDASGTLRIALVAYDTQASTEVSGSDFYRPAKPGLTRDSDPDASRFRTTVYWGDLALVSGETELAAKPRPSEQRVLDRHNRYWPPEPNRKAWTGKSFELAVSAPGGLPAAGFPLEMGIPMPEAMVQEPGAFRLRQGGEALFAQKSVSGTWPDGSLRWVQVRFPVKSSSPPVTLSFHDDGATPPPGMTIQNGDPIQIDTGTLVLQANVGDPLTGLTWKGAPVVETVRLSLDEAAEIAPGTCDTWRVVEEGPFFTRVAADGRFEGLAHSHGSFSLYVSVYRGLPYVKFWLRLFNDTPRDLDIAHFRMEFVLPDEPGEMALPHGAVGGDFELRHARYDAYTLGDAVIPAAGPFFVQWAAGALAVKHFRELSPKGFVRAGKVLALDLIAGGDSPVTLTPGEALSHEIWLGLGKMDGAVLAAAVEQPPVLQNAGYYSESGALGPAAPLDPKGAMAAHLAAQYEGKSWTELGQSLGLRHFPDGQYLGNPHAWANNYNGRMMGLWGAWWMTGDRAWFDRASAVCAHLQDVAIVHTDVPGKNWLGAMHGPGADHVAGPWNPMLHAEGFSLYAHLTGNPDARSEFLGVADYCMRTGAGLRGSTARHVAAPFATVCAAYRETGELTFLEAGTERLAAMAERVDRRRGVWYDWHGSAVYPGNVPWMAAQLAQPLYTWYQLTGDVEAAQLLVGLAESLICENTPWEAPGAMRTSSPNPRYPSSTALDPFIIPMLCAAFELTEDPFFQDAARAQWERWRAAPEFQEVFNLSWHWPWLNACVAEFPDEGGQARESQ